MATNMYEGLAPVNVKGAVEGGIKPTAHFDSTAITYKPMIVTGDRVTTGGIDGTGAIASTKITPEDGAKSGHVEGEGKA